MRYNLFASMGAGNDGVNITTTTAPAAFLYGGTRSNTLEIDAASRTGIRTLRTYQFQKSDT